MSRSPGSVFIATSLDGFIARPDGGLDSLEVVNQPGCASLQLRYEVRR